MDAQLRKALSASTFTDPASLQTRAIVLDYLCHNSYTSTARAFSRDSTLKNVDADGDEIMSGTEYNDDLDLPEDMLKQVEIRKDIRHKILGGRVEEAIDLLNEHFPTVLEESAEPFVPHRPSSPDKVEFVAQTSVDPAHLVLNLRILAFIEACRTIPLEFRPPGVTDGSDAEDASAVNTDKVVEPLLSSAPPTSAVFGQNDSAAHEEHLHNLLNRIRKLYGFAHALEKANDRGTYLDELGQVGGLLAYKIPELSPMAKYLSQARREAVADQINSAVLYRTGRLAISRLELYTRYTTTLWSWMHDMRFELPPQRKWPLAVQPPPSRDSTDESKRKSSRPKDSRARDIVPAFDLRVFLDTKSP